MSSWIVKVLFGYFWESTFLDISKKVSRRAWGPRKPLMGAPPRGGRPRWGCSMGAPHATPFSLLYLYVWHKVGVLWYFWIPSLPLGFPINRRCVGCHKMIPCSHIHMPFDVIWLSLSPSHEKSFRRAERLSVFRWELVLDGEALPDRWHRMCATL